MGAWALPPLPQTDHPNFSRLQLLCTIHKCNHELQGFLIDANFGQTRSKNTVLVNLRNVLIWVANVCLLLWRHVYKILWELSLEMVVFYRPILPTPTTNDKSQD